MDEFLKTWDQLKKTKQKFKDPAFPANDKSLGPKNAGLKWLPFSEIFKNDYSLFSQTANSVFVSPEDVCQGELGDCYFLSSISSISFKHPDVISDLFITQQINPYGIHCLYMCINGTWRAVMVDEYIPTKHGKPIFCQSKNRSVWVILMEKAWAKIFGSYTNIIAGDPREVLRAFTGGNTWTLKTSDEDFVERFASARKQKCVMVSGSKGHHPEFEKLGFVQGHAYSILKNKHIEHPTLGKKTLLKMRNPWGEREWRYLLSCI